MPSHVEPLPVVWQKRVFDVVVSSLLLIVTAPLFLFFMLLIVVEHCLRRHPLDPLFYSEYRISRGKQFKLYKFNIFDHRVVEAHKQHNTFVHTKELEKNGNLILVGTLLKQIYLDELPQLYNVLKGEMSLVGPRPLNLKVFTRVAERSTPPQALVQGGMTGNFQSLKDTKGMTADALEAEYIQAYVQGGWRLVFVDIFIIFRTLKVLLRAKGV